MRRGTHTWNVLCLLTALSMFFLVMAEARPRQFRVLEKSIMRRHFRVLTDVKRLPDLTFFWTMSQKLSQRKFGLSNQQKLRIREEFRWLFIMTIAARQDALDEELRLGQRNLSVYAHASLAGLQFEQILAKHRNAIHNIFTPEQHRRRHARKAAGRMVAKLQAATPFPKTVSVERILVQLHTDAAEGSPEVQLLSARPFSIQTSSRTLLESDLRYLQVFLL